MRSSLLAAAALAGLALGSAFPSTARAEWEPAGSVGASLHVGIANDGGDLGGALLVDLWQPIGLFRLGLAGGVGALTSGESEVGVGGEESVSRAFASLGLSLGIAHRGELLGGSLIARVGGWGGANDDGKSGNLRGGLWLTVGGSLDIPFGERLTLSLTADFWLVIGGDTTRTALAPGLALRWQWPEAEPIEPWEPEDEPDPATLQEGPR